jgi:PAS domain-containing protein
MTTTAKPIADLIDIRTRCGNNTPKVDYTLDIPTVKDAQEAYDAHMKEMVPYQAPDAPKEMQKARQVWLDKKFRLLTCLDLAKKAEGNTWTVTFRAPFVEETEEKVIGISYRSKSKKTLEVRLAEHNRLVQAMQSLEEGSVRWEGARQAAYVNKRAMKQYGYPTDGLIPIPNRK